VDVFRLQFSKEQLERAPEAERVLYLVAGQFINELNILTKLSYFATHSNPGEEVRKRANITASMLLLQLTAGKVNESWELIKAQFSRLYPSYEADLDDLAKQQYEYLKRYFGRSSLVNTIRNTIGFHFDVDVIIRGYAAFPVSGVFASYLTEPRGNSLFDGSSMATILGMTKLIDEDNSQAGLDKFAVEIPDIATRITDFFFGYMSAFVGKYFVAADLTGDSSESSFQIEDGPPLDQVIIPLFCLPPSTGSA
jgi:hypothetical protein